MGERFSEPPRHEAVVPVEDLPRRFGFFETEELSFTKTRLVEAMVTGNTEATSSLIAEYYRLSGWL